MPDRTGQPDAPDEFQLRSAIPKRWGRGAASSASTSRSPLTSTNPVRAASGTRYKIDEYAKTPATLRQIDSLLAAIAADSTAECRRPANACAHSCGRTATRAARSTRSIYERFGVDSLFPAITSPVAMLRTYSAAEKARGHPAPFSPPAWRVLDAFEQSTGIRWHLIPERAPRLRSEQAQRVE